MKVLITRSEVDAAPLVDLLSARNIVSVVDPMIKVELRLGSPLGLTGVQALLMTSANGVRAYCARNSERDLPLFAVGDATAREAMANGFSNIFTARGDVSHLAKLVQIKLSKSGGILLHVAGTKTAGDLAGNLLGAGFEYRRDILYNVVAAQFLHSNTIMALTKKEVQGVLLYSPRTAQIFCRCAVADLGENMLSGVTAYCLSEAVADKAKALKWRAVVVASSPTQLELIHVVARGV
jgi:uroporphyrinogen-III synthase